MVAQLSCGGKVAVLVLEVYKDGGDIMCLWKKKGGGMGRFLCERFLTELFDIVSLRKMSAVCGPYLQTTAEEDVD
ncbi:hypothetical protein QVD17_39599 [Tagetes erecta]|uniref:Uncharacterized protein n=1 Tax=Tagetes erecta TaxID=13708 RepID=A0AAD8NHA6_TARER|nr:hypothetical protein QVD17_39599 [Tagetes erecta]